MTGADRAVLKYIDNEDIYLPSGFRLNLEFTVTSQQIFLRIEYRNTKTVCYKKCILRTPDRGELRKIKPWIKSIRFIDSPLTFFDYLEKR